MRARFRNRKGCDRWADIEEVTMVVRPDGTIVTSLPDAYCSERLLTPEEADKANRIPKSRKRRPKTNPYMSIRSRKTKVTGKSAPLWFRSSSRCLHGS